MYFSNHRYDDYLTLWDRLNGAVTLTKIANTDKYSEHGIRFDRRGTFSFPSGGFGCNVIVFGVDMGSSVHDSVLGEGPT